MLQVYRFATANGCYVEVVAFSYSRAHHYATFHGSFDDPSTRLLSRIPVCVRAYNPAEWS